MLFLTDIIAPVGDKMLVSQKSLENITIAQSYGVGCA